MPDETIEVVHSDETMVEAPSEQPIVETPVTPTEPTEPVTPTVPEVELFELPDGRKVDAETLSKEWKENFYPDYTRKSQALAAKDNITKPDDKNTVDNEWVPQTYEELLQKAEERAIQKLDAREQARIESEKAVETEVVTQLESLKKIDPTLNENALFLHANKYGFRDLSLAHQNMKDMNILAKTVQETTAKNIAKRADPVSITPGSNGGTRPDPSSFSSAQEYLRSLK